MTRDGIRLVKTVPAVLLASLLGAAPMHAQSLFNAAGLGTPVEALDGRARALGQTDGLVKILAHAETDRVLGVHMIGPRVGELIVEAAMAMAFGASSEDMARVCHAHPTLHEVVKEAALDVDGRAIHM